MLARTSARRPWRERRGSADAIYERSINPRGADALMAPTPWPDFCGLSLRLARSCCCPAASASARSTRASRASRIATPARIVLKGTTREPRLGNPAASRLRNADGHAQRDRPAESRRRPRRDAILPTLDFTETRFIANVCGSTIEDYVEVTRRFDDSPIDAIEINISCPNIKEGGVQFGNYPEMSARVVAACRAVTKQAADHQAVAEPDRYPRERAPLHRGRHRCARSDQHGDGHGDRRAHAPAGDRQRAGRPVGAGDQADRAAQGAPGVRGRTAAQRADHRPGRHLLGERCAGVPDRRRERRSASARRCSTIRWCAPKINAGIADYLAQHSCASVTRADRHVVGASHR